MRRLSAAVTALLVGLVSVVSAPPATAAKTFTACVKKSNGKTVLHSGKKKCKKGWKKVTWTKSGPTGAQGPQGATGNAGKLGEVYDGSGTRVGDLSGLFTLGTIAIFSVRIDGGDYTYLANGWLFWQGPQIYYGNASCSGTPFVSSLDPIEAAWAVGSPATRFVYRVSDPTLGPATAFKVQGTSENVTALNRWSRDADGTCSADSPLTGVRIPLTQVAAPPDRPGPLTIR